MPADLKLYEPHVHLLPLATRYVVAKHPDGTRWAIPCSRILGLACAYYEEEGWDDEAELGPGEQQPTGDELRGIVEVNGDLVQHAKEAWWDDVKDLAVLVAGAGTEPVKWSGRYDKLWWFEERGGALDEMTTVPDAEQLQNALGPLVLDDYAMSQWHAMTDDDDRRRHEVLTYFRGGCDAP